MNQNIIYKSFLPGKWNSLLYPVLGISLGLILIVPWQLILENNMQADARFIGLNLLAFGLMMKGLFNKTVVAIILDPKTLLIEIQKESLFRSQKIETPLHQTTIELKSTENKKRKKNPKMKLVISANGKELMEIHTTIFQINADKLRKAHYLLKNAKEQIPVTT